MATQYHTTLIRIPMRSIRLMVGEVWMIRQLLVVGIALISLAATLHADIFVSNLGDGTIQRFDDSGNRIGNGPFISGLGGTEGVSCVKKSTNELYVATNGSVVHVYNLTTGGFLRNLPITGSGDIAAISFSIDGSVLYLADYTGGHIFGVNPSNGNVIYTATNGPVHDVRVGPDGFVYATYFANNTGVLRYSMDLSTHTQFVAPGDHGLTRPAGMAFDASGNLWVSNFSNSAGFISEYQNNAGVSSYIGTVSDTTGGPLGLDLGPDHNIYVANLSINTIGKIDIAGGTYALTTFINMFLDEPKYVNFSENCCDTGYIEICKQSDPAHPVTGTYTFTPTASFFTGSPVQVPVGQCSGAQQVPSGAVTLTETAVLGIAVDDVTAYSYNDLGFYVDELNTWLIPELHAIVNVVAGDVELETIATFTNYAAPPGQLKVCKIAGPGVPVGTPFTFQIRSSGFPLRVTIPAGPADQGGYCQIIGTYQVNTPVLVTELLGIDSPYQVSNITVQPADRGSHYTQTSVIVTIGDGVTEASFTNIPKTRQSMMPANQFTSVASGSVTQIDIAVGYASGVNTFYASLWTSNNGLPGTQLARWDNLSSGTSFGQCCGVVSIMTTGLSLDAGNQYFLVLGPENISSNTLEWWNLNNTGVTGLDLYSTDGGFTWNSNGIKTLGAFDVKGSVTFFSDFGSAGNLYQCCAGYQISGSSAGSQKP